MKIVVRNERIKSAKSYGCREIFVLINEACNREASVKVNTSKMWKARQGIASNPVAKAEKRLVAMRAYKVFVRIAL